MLRCLRLKSRGSISISELRHHDDEVAFVESDADAAIAHPIAHHGHQPNLPRATNAPMYVYPNACAYERLTDDAAAVNWADAQRRVLKSYREWIRAVRYSLLFGPADVLK